MQNLQPPAKVSSYIDLFVRKAKNGEGFGVMRVRVSTAVVLACLVAVLCSHSRADADQPAGSVPPTLVEAKYPDQGYLSNYRYANAYFGFSIDLPADAGLRPIPIRNPSDGGIPLLETLGRLPERAAFSIAAYPVPENRSDARALLRRELDNELSIGVEELHALSKSSIAGQQFFWFETRRGIDQHSVYAVQVNGYVIHIVAAARDPKLLQQLHAAVQRMRFFPPASVGEFAGVGAEPYNGPAIPFRVLQQLKANPPARQIDNGKLTGNVYENGQIGFVYELPKGWHTEREAAVMPAVERGREQTSGQPAIGPNEKFLREACERTLVSSWRRVPDTEGQISYDEFGEVSLFAMPLVCFPNAKFPDDLARKEPLRDFLVAYGESHPIMRDMKGARAFTREGRTFIVMDGVVAYREAGDALSRRVSVALALTRQRDYLLAFFFAAPHEAELRELANAKISFDPEPSRQPASATASAAEADRAAQPGGAVATGSTTGAAKPPATNTSLPASDTRAATGAAANAPPPPDVGAPSAMKPGDAKPAEAIAETSSTSPPPAANAAVFHPSLLKAGENLEDQQMKGAPLPPANHK